MRYEKVNLNQKLIAGVKECTSNALESEYEEAKIPLLWRTYFQSSILSPIPDECENSPAYALYYEYKDGIKAEYSVLIGTEVSKIKNLQSEYAHAKIYKGDYLRFDGEGPLPETVVKLWQGIWKFFEQNKEYKRVFKSDFEVYLGEEDVSIYIGIKEK